MENYETELGKSGRIPIGLGPDAHQFWKKQLDESRIDSLLNDGYKPTTKTNDYNKRLNELVDRSLPVFSAVVEADDLDIDPVKESYEAIGSIDSLIHNEKYFQALASLDNLRDYQQPNLGFNFTALYASIALGLMEQKEGRTKGNNSELAKMYDKVIDYCIENAGDIFKQG